MNELADVISSEFEDALDVKNPKSLHRGIFLLLSSTVTREGYKQEHNDLKSAVELIALRMEEGFKRMDQRFMAVDERFISIDKRFEAVDKRFEAMDNRFNRQTALISIGFVVIATLITVYQYLG